jgi:hypothetical protein
MRDSSLSKSVTLYLLHKIKLKYIIKDFCENLIFYFLRIDHENYNIIEKSFFIIKNNKN